MMSPLPLLGFVLFSAQTVVSAPATPAPEADEATYRAFYTADHDERIRVFNEISAEQKAGLVRTHLRRWLAANRADLTGEQLEVLNEALGLISADVYIKPAPPELT